MEVFFAGQKIGEGIGRTRREAQCHAAEGSIFYLINTCPSLIMIPATCLQQTQYLLFLNELCMMEGLSVAYQTQPQFSPIGARKMKCTPRLKLMGNSWCCEIHVQLVSSQAPGFSEIYARDAEQEAETRILKSSAPDGIIRPLPKECSSYSVKPLVHFLTKASAKIFNVKWKGG
ncbi:protein-serine/threonine phosphatase [Salvia divinorum]|uniref:Protein-serine/threonine phosphatase n=1 Tax=Salvia divinorum TaxID=28513 RepID=A0ABD1IHW6_SALDI